MEIVVSKANEESLEAEESPTDGENCFLFFYFRVCRLEFVNSLEYRINLCR